MKRIIRNIKASFKARALLVDGKYYECMDLCSAQIESTPHDFDSFYYRGQCKTHLKLYEDAINDFKSALINVDKGAFPNLMTEDKQDAAIRIANIYRRERKTEQALTQLENLIKKYPDCAGAYSEKAGILSDLGQYKVALDSINLAIKYSPKDVKAINFRGKLIYHLSR